MPYLKTRATSGMFINGDKSVANPITSRKSRSSILLNNVDGTYDCYCELQNGQIVFSVEGQIAVRRRSHSILNVDISRYSS